MLCYFAHLQRLPVVEPLDPHGCVVHGLDAALQVHVLTLVQLGQVGLDEVEGGRVRKRRMLKNDN